MSDHRADEPAAAPAARRASTARTVVMTVVTLLVLVLVAKFFAQYTSWAEVRSAVTSMPAPWLAAVLVATVVNIFVYVWPFQVALPGIRYWPAFLVRQTSFMISNVVPAGGAIGLGTQYGMLAADGFGTGPASSAITVNSTWNLLVTLAMPVIGSIALVLSTGLTAQYATVAAVGLLVIAVAVVVFAVILRSERGARRVAGLASTVLRVVLRPLKKGQQLDLTPQVLAFRDSTVDVVRARWGELTVSNFAMQLTSFLILYLALRGLEAGDTTHVTFAAALASFSVARLASFIPITPGGIGTVDAALTALLVQDGATHSQAVAADLVWRAGALLPQVALGMVTYLVWGAQARRRRAAQPA